jgi:beta-galactosidase/beta-glucuronidase
MLRGWLVMERRDYISDGKMKNKIVSTSTQHGYPRPLLQRADWISLNGSWDFAIDAEGRIEDPAEVQWGSPILVPFAPETEAGGIRDTSLFRVCWYRRLIDPPQIASDSRLLLHFGAVDYRATVWANGRIVGRHEGGYTPFTCDLTNVATGQIELIVRAEDDPADLAKPRGKQDWLLNSHSIWYERTSGI